MHTGIQKKKFGDSHSFFRSSYIISRILRLLCNCKVFTSVRRMDPVHVPPQYIYIYIHIYIYIVFSHKLWFMLLSTVRTFIPYTPSTV